MNAKPIRIAIVAGEPSGDVLGARLMTALQRATGGKVRIEGIGGEQMIQAGLSSRFPMAELSHMGIAELLPHVPRLLRRVRESVAWLRASPPDLLVTVDMPSFSRRVARALTGTGIPRLHYVAPTVWAWRPKRAAEFAETFDHLLALLPFEPPYFTVHGLACTYVGHPALETMAGEVDRAGFRRRHGIDPSARIVCLLPGSRASEVSRLLPDFAAAIRELSQRHQALHIVLPTVAPVAAMVEQGAKEFGVALTIVANPDDKRDAFAASDVALAASGTVAVELAVAGTPAVIAYRGSPISAAIVRRLVKIEYASLINLMLDRPATPELLQENCRPGNMARELDRLLSDPAARSAQLAAYAEALAKLAVDGLPSDRAAAVALSMIAHQRAPLPPLRPSGGRGTGS